MIKKNSRKKFQYIFGLSSILLVLWALIYPSNHYPGGIDSVIYQSISNTILYYGKIKFFLHPLSAWGFYPFSHEPGTSIFLASSTLLTGINQFDIIIPLDYILGTMATMTIFCIMIKIKRDIRFVLIGTFIFTVAPRIIGYIVFVFTSRGFLILLTPTFLLLSILYLKKGDRKSHRIELLGFLVFFALSIIHKMFLLLIPFIFSLISVIVLEHYNFHENIKKFNRIKVYKFMNSRRSKAIFWLGLVVMIISSLILVTRLIPTRKINVIRFEQEGFFSGGGTLWIIANAGISMAGGVGIGFVLFGILGFLAVCSKERKRPIDTLFLLSFVVSIPLIMSSVYFRPFFVIYTSIFSGYGFLWLIKKNLPLKKVFVITLLIILIIGSVFYSSFMIERWHTAREREAKEDIRYNYYITHKTYNTGIYSRYNFVRGEKYASYSQPELVSQRIELISTHARYESWYSIGEINRIVEGQGDYWKIVRTGDIARPYSVEPSQDKMYENFIPSSRDYMQIIVLEHNITVVHTPPDEGENDNRITYMYNNFYKMYENDEDVFWKY